MGQGVRKIENSSHRQAVTGPNCVPQARASVLDLIEEGRSPVASPKQLREQVRLPGILANSARRLAGEKTGARNARLGGQFRETDILAYQVVAFQRGPDQLPPEVESHAVDYKDDGLPNAAFDRLSSRRHKTLVEGSGCRDLLRHDFRVSRFHQSSEEVV